MARPLQMVEDREFRRWGIVLAEPHASLRAHVRRYCGWFERNTVPLHRRELPTHETPLIISFGEPIRVSDTGNPTRWTEHGSFAAGAYDSHLFVEAKGFQSGVQIDFTILGMRLFLGRPLGEMTNRTVALDDLFGSAANRLTMELQDAHGWDARFDLLDREISRRLSVARAPADPVMWAWRRIVASSGRVSIGSLVAETGWSQKHLIRQFREHLGLTPKAFARVMRFGRAANVLRTQRDVRLVDLALTCGYYDQSHFVRDFQTFAGVSPTELLRSLRSNDDWGQAQVMS